MTNNSACCTGHNPTPGAVEQVNKKSCPEETLDDLAATFKILGEPVRIKILHALSISNLCVCDLSDLLGMTHSAISHQLRILRTARMVRFKKDGRRAIYSLNDKHVEIIMQTALAHMQGDGCEIPQGDK
ncbi:metalloregulator ArsR/SmtB family transcription factor [Desulfovibrio sp. JC022]|uniref:ArsR/SmtB family transcription factor n=1 Tax=Desulfovibrio sp. JC022 TaxID=2593642 RepID=UPI0013CF61FB|nr:metalloregulator ArsR/SmtB family transcription factor [Desulfovibrio sp. JC022]NDV21553.1 winged helix-turn-helix transcriptional regulator [Desulfovibrio sp. JC022]